MDHMLKGVPVPLKQGVGPDKKVIISEHTPDVKRLKPFAVIGIYKKIIFHGFLPVGTFVKIPDNCGLYRLCKPDGGVNWPPGKTEGINGHN